MERETNRYNGVINDMLGIAVEQNGNQRDTYVLSKRTAYLTYFYSSIPAESLLDNLLPQGRLH